METLIHRQETVAETETQIAKIKMVMETVAATLDSETVTETVTPTLTLEPLKMQRLFKLLVLIMKEMVMETFRLSTAKATEEETVTLRSQFTLTLTPARSSTMVHLVNHQLPQEMETETILMEMEMETETAMVTLS